MFWLFFLTERLRGSVEKECKWLGLCFRRNHTQHSSNQTVSSGTQDEASENKDVSRSFPIFIFPKIKSAVINACACTIHLSVQYHMLTQSLRCYMILCTPHNTTIQKMQKRMIAGCCPAARSCY